MVSNFFLAQETQSLWDIFTVAFNLKSIYIYEMCYNVYNELLDISGDTIYIPDDLTVGLHPLHQTYRSGTQCEQSTTGPSLNVNEQPLNK